MPRPRTATPIFVFQLEVGGLPALRAIQGRHWSCYTECYVRETETKKNVKIRVAKAGKELELQHKFDHIVINNDFSTACKEVRGLVINFLEK